MSAIVLTLVGTGIAGSASVETAGADKIERCPDARHALAFYRGRYAEHRAKMGAGVLTVVRPRKPRNCADAHYLSRLWKQRAARARVALIRYLVRQRAHTLRDYAFGSGNQAWPKAVQEVQRVFPGTNGWLLSCSAAEGGHGRWVGYGGQAYSTWLRDSDTVGGPLQFRYSTFKGMFRHGLEYVRARGYRVPGHLTYVSDIAWRSALGQAIAGGWARYTGNDDSHWSASWGNGC